MAATGRAISSIPPQNRTTSTDRLSALVQQPTVHRYSLTMSDCQSGCPHAIISINGGRWAPTIAPVHTDCQRRRSSTRDCQPSTNTIDCPGTTTPGLSTECNPPIQHLKRPLTGTRDEQQFTLGTTISTVGTPPLTKRRLTGNESRQTEQPPAMLATQPPIATHPSTTRQSPAYRSAYSPATDMRSLLRGTLSMICGGCAVGRRSRLPSADSSSYRRCRRCRRRWRSVKESSGVC